MKSPYERGRSGKPYYVMQLIRWFYQCSNAQPNPQWHADMHASASSLEWHGGTTHRPDNPTYMAPSIQRNNSAASMRKKVSSSSAAPSSHSDPCALLRVLLSQAGQCAVPSLPQGGLSAGGMKDLAPQATPARLMGACTSNDASTGSSRWPYNKKGSQTPARVSGRSLVLLSLSRVSANCDSWGCAKREVADQRGRYCNLGCKMQRVQPVQAATDWGGALPSAPAVKGGRPDAPWM